MEKLSNKKFLITGGAGFIGANLVEYLLQNKAPKVRVLDNLSNGYYENIKEFEDHPNFEFIEGDITDLETCQKAVNDMDVVLHQAALGSVPRSINDPIRSNECKYQRISQYDGGYKRQRKEATNGVCRFQFYLWRSSGFT